MTSRRPFDAHGLWALLVFTVAVGMGCVSMPGCVGTQETEQTSYQAYVIAGEARASLITSLAVLNRAGYIDEEDYESIDTAIKLTGLALELWTEALLKGEPTDAAEQQFYENFEVLKGIRDPASLTPPDRKPDT